MNILITGSNGFIGRNLKKSLSQNHKIFSPTSKELDLTNSESVDSYLRNKYFDWVIHCAIEGGRRSIPDSPDTTYNNLKIFFNLFKNRDRFRYLINFASGAEFDRRTEVNSSSNILSNSYPIDYYGMSKNIITRIIESSDEDIFNFRIYGLFGIDEQENRFIKNSINQHKIGNPIVIDQDKFFDYFYIEDLVNLVLDVVKSPNQWKTQDLVYQKKYRLTDIANIINNQSPKKTPIQIKTPTMGLSYSGTNTGLKVNFKLIGLEEGIKRVYNAL